MPHLDPLVPLLRFIGDASGKTRLLRALEDRRSALHDYALACMSRKDYRDALASVADLRELVAEIALIEGAR